MEKEMYRTIWRNKWITSHAKSIDDFIETFEHLAINFKEWKEMGIKLSDDSGIGDDYATFYTDDMEVAIKAGFTVKYVREEEKEYLQTLSGNDVEVPRKKLK